MRPYRKKNTVRKGGDTFMTMAQWGQHQEHLDKHITWPATKAQIIAACQGTDVEPSVLDEIKTKLEDGGKIYTKEEAKNILVT